MVNVGGVDFDATGEKNGLAVVQKATDPCERCGCEWWLHPEKSVVPRGSKYCAHCQYADLSSWYRQASLGQYAVEWGSDEEGQSRQ